MALWAVRQAEETLLSTKHTKVEKKTYGKLFSELPSILMGELFSVSI